MDKPNKNTTTLSVLPSSCDHTGRLGIFDTFKIFMDLANEHARILGIDQKTLMNEGLFWLTVKTRIRFYKRVPMDSLLTAETWPANALSRKSDRFYRLSDQDGLVAEGRTEWAILDQSTGSLTSISKAFDSNFEFNKDTVQVPDSGRIRFENENATFRGPYRVSSSDTDMGKHMNNTAYVRALLGHFTTAELDEMDIQDMSIVFKKSAHEGDLLKMGFVRNEKTIDAGLFFEDGSPAVLSRIECK